MPVPVREEDRGGFFIQETHILMRLPSMTRGPPGDHILATRSPAFPRIPIDERIASISLASVATV